MTVACLSLTDALSRGLYWIKSIRFPSASLIGDAAGVPIQVGETTTKT